ncbi:MAG TPA: universal stress protein [Acidimicrobiales bacterium]|nr:universal stress protein [Acidimicrobiales bacterium]
MTPLQSIVVGYDGSPDADTAVRWALRLATPTSASVTVVHATGILEHLGTRFSRDQTPPALVAIAKECEFDEGRLHWFVDEGDACSVLLRAAGPPIAADLLVVGSRGQGKRAGFLLGSTSLEVTKHAATPVVVVPSGYALP